MPSYVIIGVQRVGFQDTASTKQKKSTELLNRPNIHILDGDLINYNILKTVVAKTFTITNANFDYLIVMPLLLHL
ncbi:hypothetical protein MKX08_007257 [Trichoderma sp. CBMAI-0020]|nr:hypothetical protein MKX08_007257 [Trichoderma sp. CBMAI-0020]